MKSKKKSKITKEEIQQINTWWNIAFGTEPSDDTNDEFWGSLVISAPAIIGIIILLILWILK